MMEVGRWGQFLDRLLLPLPHGNRSSVLDASWPAKSARVPWQHDEGNQHKTGPVKAIHYY
jgi:hypothetical protein